MLPATVTSPSREGSRMATKPTDKQDNTPRTQAPTAKPGEKPSAQHGTPPAGKPQGKGNR